LVEQNEKSQAEAAKATRRAIRADERAVRADGRAARERRAREAAEALAERLAARMRELGIDPDA
jgi:hypothetical protein